MFDGFIMKSRARILIAIFCGIIPSIAFGQITMENIPELQKIDVIEHLGESIPLNLEFTNDEGRSIFLPGQQFQMITISINPEESYRLAAAKKKSHIEALNKPVKKNSWAFLTDSTGNTKKLANALGFKYYYVEDRDEYAHPAVSFILTEDGKISRYLYGIEYKESDLRLSLLEASKGEIGTTLDRIILYCFQYDPDAGGYVIFAGNLMRIGGVITVLIIGSVLGILWRKELQKRRIIKTS
jgi:protein SCO1/2